MLAMALTLAGTASNSMEDQFPRKKPAKAVSKDALAKEGASESEAKLLPISRVVDDKNSAYGHYLKHISDKISAVQKNAMLSETAKKFRGLKAAPVIRFTVSSEGAFVNLNILESSGDTSIDDFAKKVVRRAFPFEPPPESIKQLTDVLVVTRIIELDFIE